MIRNFVLFLSKICVMIVTFKPIVINKRKDGTWPVKIRVTFKGVSRRLPTTLSATSADLTRGGRIKSADLLNKAEAIVRQMREAAAKISPFDLEDWDVDRVVRFIKDDIRGGDNFRLDFFAFADGFTATKGEGTRRDYATAVNALEQAFRQAVQEAVKARLTGESPAAGASAQGLEDDELDDETYYRLQAAGR